MHRLRQWLQRHPLVRDALLWAVPALIFGAVLRGMLLSYSPYAYWGSDSNSYYSFAEQLLSSGKISLYDKRRYVYPLLLLPVSLLPGSDLRWLAWLQHGLGLITLVPLAYCVRKTFAHWRWLVVPVTAVFAGIPILIWYEHELLAESVFFAAALWACAGWMAWVSESRPERKRRLWWLFFAAFAVLVLTKPAGRFFWLGIIVGLVAAGAWRFLRWREYAALAVAGVLTLTIGQDSQGMWLLYTSAFPLTRLDTPLHAAYKAEVSDLVAEAQRNLHEFKIDEDRAWKQFLKHPEEHPERPLWEKLGRDLKLRNKVYRDLALEGIRSRPDLFALIATQKIMSSANPDDFKAERFETGRYARKFEHLYERYTTESPRRLRMLFGLASRDPLPPYEEVRRWIEPHPDSRAAVWLTAYAEGFEPWLRLEHDRSREPGAAVPVDTPTAVGWWVIAGALVSFWPRYFRRLGVWTLSIGGYLLGVFLVGGANARFFGSAWFMIVLLLAAPADLILRLIFGFARKPRFGACSEAT